MVIKSQTKIMVGVFAVLVVFALGMLYQGQVQNGPVSAQAPDGHSLDGVGGDPIDAVFVDHVGNVGIGTTSPSRKLELAASQNSAIEALRSWSTVDGHAGGLTFSKSSSPSIGIYSETRVGENLGFLEFYGSDQGSTISEQAAFFQVIQDGLAGGARVPTSMIFGTGSDVATAKEQMRIHSSGNVGIGTTNPTGKLHVSGAPGSLWLTNSASNGRTWRLGEEQQAGKFTLYDNTGAAYRLVVDVDGNVGIGTTNPTGRLHVSGAPGSLWLTNAASNGRTWRLGEEQQAGKFTLYDNTAAAYRLVVDGDGNVGIGTTSPSSQLELAGSQRSAHQSLRSWSTVGGHAGGLTFSKSSSPSIGTYSETGANENLGFLEFYGSDQGSTISEQAAFFQVIQDGPAGGARVPTSMIFGTGSDVATAKEQMRIHSSGNVGIGTTNPTQKLSVNGSVLSKETVVSTAASRWPDFVFDDQYDLMSLEQLEQFIENNGHLPGIPTAEKVAEDGIALGEMNARLLEKLEEQTLYILHLKGELARLEGRISVLED